MINHLILLYYLMLLMAGMGLIAMLSYSALKSQDRVLKAVTLFFIAFTIWVVIGILQRYLRLNLFEFYFQNFELITFINLIGRTLTLVAILHFTHQLIPVRKSRWIMMVYSLFIVVGFIYRSMINKTIIEKTTGASIHSPDLLDVVSTVICMYAFSCFVWYRKNLENDLHRFLVKNMIVILVVFLPAVVLETYHLFPGNFKIVSLIYLSFTILFYLYMRRFHLLFRSSQSAQSVEVQSPHLDNLDISNREKEIMTLILKGYSNSDIARELFISISTVKTHIYNLYKKIGVKNRFEMISRFQPSPNQKSG